MDDGVYMEEECSGDGVLPTITRFRRGTFTLHAYPERVHLGVQYGRTRSRMVELGIELQVAPDWCPLQTPTTSTRGFPQGFKT